MKKITFFLCALLISAMSFAETYSHTFASGNLKTGTVTLNGVSWTTTMEGSTYYGWDANKGIQIGSKKSYCSAYSLTTSHFADYMVTNITVNASMASSGTAQMQVSVGGVDYIAKTKLTTSAKNYEGSGSSSGDVVISFTNTARAFYIKSISITYQAVSAGEGMILVDQSNVDFGKITKTQTITVTGQNLTSPIAAQLQDGSNFSVEGTLTAEGGELTVNYIATEAGKHTDVLVLTSDDVTTEVALAGEVLNLEGAGTKENPYTVADVIALGLTDKTQAWVVGYIIGVLNSNDNNKLETTGTTVASNIVLASTADATANYIPVALPSGDARSALNLVDNPTNLGIKVAVFGTLELYFSKAGVRNVSDYVILTAPVVNHTITVSANPAEAGTVTGAGEYEEGTEATLTATAAEGYEFVNWTENEVEVSTDAEYTFEVLADHNLVANFKKSVVTITETYTLPAEAADTNKGGQWYVAVSVEEQDKYQIIIPGYNGPGTYDGEDVLWRVNVDDEWTTMHATVTVTYDEENNLDVYVISATTEDGSTIYNVTLKVGHKAIEEEPEMPVIPLESYMPIVTKITENLGDEIEPWWITSYIWKNGEYDPMEFNLTVTISEYFTELTGYIGNEEVIAFEGAELIAGDEEGYAILRAKATDGTNTYTIDLMAELTTEEEGGTRVINVVEAKISPNSEYKTDLDIYGWSDTDEKVTVTLWEGTSKLYGEYTDDLNVYIGDWKQYSLVEETTATFNLVDGLAVFNATVANGNDTVVLTMSGAPWVHPKDIVPTDTVNHTILEGTIGLMYSMFLNIKGESDDIYVNISTNDKTATSEDIENCSSAYVTIDDVQINLLRGQFEIVTVGDVKIAYIGALGEDHKWYNIIVTTGSEAPTALDNLGTTVAPVKVIVNGQLIITKDGVQYNAQGAVVK